MATYAGDEFANVRKAIASILAQTHRHLELLVCLDGSYPRERVEYLDRLRKDDPRVRVLSLPENRGPAAARNAAIDQAAGEYIAIFDADDLAAPERIERQIAYLREHDLDLAGTFMHYIDDHDAIVGRKTMPVSPEQLRRTAFFLNPINNPTAFAKADVFKSHRYDERFRRGQDYHLWARLVAQGYRLGNMPEYLHSLRRGSGFLSRRNHIYFWVELHARTILLKMYPWYLRPVMAPLVLMLASLRLMPPSVLRGIYKLRGRMQWRSTQ
jgi:glycosyltransferase involved in cell wall biosynthesis